MSTEIITQESIQLHASIDTDAILAAGLSRAEEFAESEMARCRLEAEKAQKEEEKLIKAFEAEGKKLANAHFKQQVKDIQSALDSIGIKGTEAQCGFAMLDGETRYSLTIIGKKHSKRASHSANISKQIVVKTPASLKKILDQMAQQVKKAKEWSAQAMEFKKRLSRLPQLERKLRGRLAEQKLSKTAEGQAIIDSMTLNIQQEVMKLPCR